MNKQESRELMRQFEERSWQPLFLAEHARRLQAGEPNAGEDCLVWLNESGNELQSEVDAMSVFFPGAIPAFRIAEMRQRISIAIGDGDTEGLAAIGQELEALDAAIRATDSRDYIPDEYFYGDYTMEEILDHVVEKLDETHPDWREEASDVGH